MPNAVMANSITARANDYGSMFFHIKNDKIASHAGETLIPMGLTLAAAQPTSGKQFIANNVAAEDVTARILYTLPVRWPTDMLMVSSAAAALASRYYKLNEEETKAALSYAALNSTDPANSYFDYCQDFKYHNGAGAQMGIMACELAKGGWRGLEDPYYGHWGLNDILGKPGENLRFWQEYSVVTQAKGLKNGDVEIVTFCGTSDFFLGPNRLLHDMLSANRVKHTYVELRGEDEDHSTHTMAFSYGVIPLVAQFFDNYFRTGKGSL